MSNNSLPPYQLSIDGFPTNLLRVHSLTGKEAMSEAWHLDVVATGDAAEPIERAALGQRAVVLFNVGEQQRAFYGIVSAVRVVQAHHADHTVKYHVRVVPRLWLLKRKRRTRIFQNMRVTDIVTAVLNEAGIATRWQLTRAYPMREYCTQYEETDYRFVQRLLAEAAIYFYLPTGPALDDAALAADAALGVAAAAGSSVVGAIAGADVGGLVGAAVSVAETLIPGDTVICADDSACYPPVNGDDPAALAASTAAALAPAVGDLLGAGGGIAGAALGAASAVAGTVIANATEGAAEVPVLHFLTNEEARVSLFDKLTRFALRNTVRSTGAMFRDYDPERPMVRLQSSAVSTVPFPPSPLEIAAMAVAEAENAASAVESLVPLPGAVTEAIGAVESVVDTAASVVNTVAGALGQKVPHEVYEHHGPFLFPKWSFANDEAPRILRQKRRRASIALAEGGCPDLSPGHRFSLHDHPVPQIDATYVVTSIEHRGQAHPERGREQEWRIYWNAFECAPSEMPYVGGTVDHEFSEGEVTHAESMVAFGAAKPVDGGTLQEWAEKLASAKPLGLTRLAILTAPAQQVLFISKLLHMRWAVSQLIWSLRRLPAQNLMAAWLVWTPSAGSSESVAAALTGSLTPPSQLVRGQIRLANVIVAEPKTDPNERDVRAYRTRTFSKWYRETGAEVSSIESEINWKVKDGDSTQKLVSWCEKKENFDKCYLATTASGGAGGQSHEKMGHQLVDPDL